jgi:peptidyl-tRNA hydrolase, PTH1 family
MTESDPPSNLSAPTTAPTTAELAAKLSSQAERKAKAKAKPAEPGPIVRPTLIVGLGNPGTKYDGTRHNIGFDVVDGLAKRLGCSLTETKKFQGQFAEASVPRLGKIRLLKPTTFMNLSGQSIRSVLSWYKLEPSALLIVYDDMDLPLGRMRMRLSGSAGGHNGMKSAIAHLSSQDFARLRLGIGAAGPKETIGHVLGQFAPAEKPLVDLVLRQSIEAIEVCLQDGVEKAMNLYNNRDCCL